MILGPDWSIIERNSIISKAPSDMSIMIVYICSEICSLDKKDQTDLTYILNISYPGYKIDHQNDKIPLEKNSDKYPFYKEFFFLIVNLHYIKLIGELLNTKKKGDFLVYLINYQTKKVYSIV